MKQGGACAAICAHCVWGVKRRTVLDRAQGLVLHAVECPVLAEAVLLPFP